MISYPDNIQLLYRDELYNKDTVHKNIEEIRVVKNMMGELFAVNVVVANNMFANLFKEDDVQ